MTTEVNLETLGVPVPLGWQVQQVKADDGTMYVKQVVMTPLGVFAFLWSGDEAEMLASKLKLGGRNAKAGLWSPVGAGQATSVPHSTHATEASSQPDGA